jgi:biotin carboxylase
VTPLRCRLRGDAASYTISHARKNSLVYAPARDEAIARMERALQETNLSGVATTQAFHLKVLNNPYFRRGEIATDFLQRRMIEHK